MNAKEHIIVAVIDIMKEETMSSECGADWSHITELLMQTPTESLINYLPENLREWARNL